MKWRVVVFTCVSPIALCVSVVAHTFAISIVCMSVLRPHIACGTNTPWHERVLGLNPPFASISPMTKFDTECLFVCL